MAQRHRMRRHGVLALPPESFAEHDDETSLPEGTRPSSSPSQNDVLSRSRKSSKKTSSFSKSKFALPTLCVQDTALGYKSRHESKRWWIRMPTYKKKKITRQLDIKRITRNIMHELWTLDHASSSLSIDDVENMVTKNIINNKDFMAGVTALFIASIGAPLQPEWHETAELFLAMHIQQRKERYGAESVIAECSHQLYTFTNICYVIWIACIFDQCAHTHPCIDFNIFLFYHQFYIHINVICIYTVDPDISIFLQ